MLSVRNEYPKYQFFSSDFTQYSQTVYPYIYEDMGIELERLLKMDEQHLHELFGVDIDNASARSAEYKYLEEHIPEYLKRLKSRGTTRRSLL